MRVCISILLLATMTCRADDLDSYLSAFNKGKWPAGVAVGVSRGNHILFLKGYGDGISSETRFELASVSKQMTAMAIMILKEQGRLHYHDAITKYLPELGVFADAVTIRHLLNHTGGLPDYMELCQEKRPIHNVDVIRLVARKKTLVFPPGTRYEYSNTGYALLASIAEKASGRSFPEVMRSSVFEPLAMAGSFVNVEAVPTGKNVVMSYTPWPFFAPALRPSVRDCNTVYGDGSIYSSAADMMRWHLGLESLVTPPTLAEAFTPVFGYGFGWKIDEANGRKIYHHSGLWAEYYNYTARLPDDKTAFVVLSNTTGVPQDAILQKISELYLRSLPLGEASPAMRTVLGEIVDEGSATRRTAK